MKRRRSPRRERLPWSRDGRVSSRVHCKLAPIFPMLSSRRLFILLYAASGAAALVYEVTWTRLLTLQMGHTVSAVSTVLAAFMGGLAIGAWIAGKFAVSGFRRLRIYAVLEVVVALIAIALPPLLRMMQPVIP